MTPQIANEKSAEVVVKMTAQQLRRLHHHIGRRRRAINQTLESIKRRRWAPVAKAMASADCSEEMDMLAGLERALIKAMPDGPYSKF